MFRQVICTVRSRCNIKAYIMEHTRTSVGIVIIGDEILKGEVKDTNSNYLCRELYAMGVRVQQVSIIRDDLDTIATVVLDFSKRFSYVLTSGGIGPTHDDVTYEGVSQAFGEDLVENIDVSNVINRWCEIFGVDKTAAQRMAMVPKSSYVHMLNIGLDGINKFPMISVKNVYIYPGVPKYLDKLFLASKHIFTSTNGKFHCSTLYTSLNEFHFTHALNEAASMYKNIVKFGSYPATTGKPYQVRITLEANDETNLQDAEGYLRSLMPQNCLIGPYESTTTESVDEIYGALNSDSNSLLKESISVIEECFHTYTPNAVCLSFNGGKDCTLLLHLAVSVLTRLFGCSQRLKAFYVQEPEPFPEMEDFVNLSIKRYNLNMFSLGGDLKPALFQLTQDHPEIKAVLIGTRRTDPRSMGLTAFQKTDSDWPALMRVSPLLDWGYHDIWKFLRTHHVPYCSLYDQGYTSLGSCSNTERNPCLQVEKSGKKYFRPAYLLKDSSEEREGRN